MARTFAPIDPDRPLADWTGSQIVVDAKTGLRYQPYRDGGRFFIRESLLDERGRGTTDTRGFQKLFWSTNPDGGHLFLGGEGEDLGGHKGYGLGMLVDLLSAGLSMGRWSLHTFEGRNGSGIAHFFGAININLFGDPVAIKKHVAGIR